MKKEFFERFYINRQVVQEAVLDYTLLYIGSMKRLHVLTLTIYWQWLAMTDIVDKQRNQLLWELVWTIVVRAVGYDGWHTVCIVESADEMV